MLTITVNAIMASTADFFTVAWSVTEVFIRLDSVLGIQILESQVGLLVQQVRSSILRPPHLLRKVSLDRICFLVIKSLHFKLCPELLRGKILKQIFCTVLCTAKFVVTSLFSSKHVHLSPPYMATPLKYPAWQARLKFCDDHKAEWVLDGIKNGFRVGYTGGQLISTFENMPSARTYGHVVVEYLAKELKRSSIAGLFQLPQFTSYTLTDLVWSQNLNQVNGE